MVPLIEEGVISYEQISEQMKVIALNEEDEKTKAIIEFYERLKKRGSSPLEGSR